MFRICDIVQCVSIHICFRFSCILLKHLRKNSLSQFTSVPIYVAFGTNSSEQTSGIYYAVEMEFFRLCTSAHVPSATCISFSKIRATSNRHISVLQNTNSHTLTPYSWEQLNIPFLMKIRYNLSVGWKQKALNNNITRIYVRTNIENMYMYKSTLQTVAYCRTKSLMSI